MACFNRDDLQHCWSSTQQKPKKGRQRSYYGTKLGHCFGNSSTTQDSLRTYQHAFCGQRLVKYQPSLSWMKSTLVKAVNFSSLLFALLDCQIHQIQYTKPTKLAFFISTFTSRIIKKTKIQSLQMINLKYCWWCLTYQPPSVSHANEHRGLTQGENFQE